MNQHFTEPTYEPFSSQSHLLTFLALKIFLLSIFYCPCSVTSYDKWSFTHLWNYLCFSSFYAVCWISSPKQTRARDSSEASHQTAAVSDTSTAQIFLPKIQNAPLDTLVPAHCCDNFYHSCSRAACWEFCVEDTFQLFWSLRRYFCLSLPMQSFMFDRRPSVVLYQTVTCRFLAVLHFLIFAVNNNLSILKKKPQNKSYTSSYSSRDFLFSLP